MVTKKAMMTKRARYHSSLNQLPFCGTLMMWTGFSREPWVADEGKITGALYFVQCWKTYTTSITVLSDLGIIKHKEGGINTD